MARASKPQRDSGRPMLCVSREEAKQKLQVQIDKGNALKRNDGWNQQVVENTRKEYYRWDTFNGNLLRALFTTDEKRDSYHFGLGGSSAGKPWLEAITGLVEDIDYAVSKLQYVLDEIDLIVLDPSVEPQKPTQPLPIPVRVETKQNRVSTKVFVVHGHDDTAKLEVARLLERLKLQAIILHEQPNRGKTLIEKFENNTSEISFAVILLTPDDVGSAKAEQVSPGLKPRARQNVVFEMGFFYAKLGRQNVCAILKGGTEQPSDVSGVVYEPMDAGGSWKTALAKEMKAAGLPVDLNDL